MGTRKSTSLHIWSSSFPHFGILNFSFSSFSSFSFYLFPCFKSINFQTTMRLLIVLTALLVPYSLHAQLSEDSSELEFGGQPPRPSPDGPPFPRFLMHVPRFARKEFFDIVSNEQLSQDQQNEQLTIWAKAFNVTVSAFF